MRVGPPLKRGRAPIHAPPGSATVGPRARTGSNRGETDRNTLPRVPVVTDVGPFPVDVAGLAELEALADDLPALLAAMAGPADVAALEALADGLPALVADLGSIW